MAETISRVILVESGTPASTLAPAPNSVSVRIRQNPSTSYLETSNPQLSDNGDICASLPPFALRAAVAFDGGDATLPGRQRTTERAGGHTTPRVAPTGPSARHPCDLHAFSTGQPRQFMRSTRTTRAPAHFAGRLPESGFRSYRMREAPSSRRSRNQVQPFRSPPFLTEPPPSMEPARGANAERGPPQRPPGKSLDSQPIQSPAETLAIAPIRGAVDAAPSA